MSNHLKDIKSILIKVMGHINLWSTLMMLIYWAKTNKNTEILLDTNK